MSVKERKVTEKPGFRDLIPHYSDLQILEILKKRKHYQPDAAALAIDEAIKRGLIHSEQDLFSEEFNEPPRKKTLFPIPENEKYRDKLRKSISRMLIFGGVIPFAIGFTIQNNGKWIEGGFISLFGLIWIAMGYLLLQKSKPIFLNVLFILVITGGGYLFFGIFNANPIILRDALIAIATYGFAFYGLLYLKKIIR
jgi:hypothetical protein